MKIGEEWYEGKELEENEEEQDEEEIIIRDKLEQVQAEEKKTKIQMYFGNPHTQMGLK